MDKLEGMEKAIEELAPDGADAPLADNVAETPDAPAEEVIADLPTEGEGDLSETEPIGEGVDYRRVMREDISELRASFSELDGITSITELPNPMRYAALRDLGLTATEAYLATSGRKTKDNRSHLSSAVPGTIGAPRCNMTRSELEGARELFPGLRDGELIGLYKKVNL